MNGTKLQMERKVENALRGITATMSCPEGPTLTLSGFKLLWQSNFSYKDAPSSPIMRSPDGKTIYLTGYNGWVYAFDRETGDEHWKRDLEKRISNALAVGKDSTVFVGDWSGVVYAFDGSLGRAQWKTKLREPVMATPVTGLPGSLLVRVRDGTLYALDEHSGKIHWRFETKERYSLSGPAVDDRGIVYISGRNGESELLAIDGATGRQLWTIPLPGHIISTFPVIGPSNLILIGTRRGIVLGIEPNDRKIVWEFNAGEEILIAPTVAQDGLAYFGSSDHNVYALDGTTGNEIWRFTAEDAIDEIIRVGQDGNLYVEAFNGYLYALNRFSGELIWRFCKADEKIFNPRFDDDGTFYVVSLEDYTFCRYAL